MKELQFTEPIISIQFIKENFNLIKTTLNERYINFSFIKGNKQLIFRHYKNDNIEDVITTSKKCVICELGQFIIILPFRCSDLRNIIIFNNEQLEFYLNERG